MPSKSQIDLLRKLSYDNRLDASEMSALIVLLDRYIALEKAHSRIEDILRDFYFNN